ncbi:hypothetical protein CXG81DRAFT_23482 [Caulochytrium protostelioides]|uniref:C-CAP/cofactor C-like domain-containing protein n=1 Tax=Caulochytrium protostelioides TaxID=1555241 RepID=A0A4P9XEF3_9FUNG|nr:hypothetical protein CXG81DRAFT_23482 [Caulochytrium protostelioides]|eukprot:RKP03926.1 hypothetical protein CXG81DRAFT_23482 [Caulochytrium protostelioides]
MAALDLSQRFHDTFVAATQALDAAIRAYVDAAAGNGTGTTAGTAPTAAAYAPLAAQLAQLQHDLTDATAFLPHYDQRKYGDRLAALNAALGPPPRTKFAFKRRPVAAAPAAPAASAVPQTAVDVAAAQNDDLCVRLTDLVGETRVVTLDRSGSARLVNLTDCTVVLRPPATVGLPPTAAPTLMAAHLQHLTRCRVLLGPVCGSVMVEDCTDTDLALGCRQLRMHASRRVATTLHAESGPIIEDCDAMRFLAAGDVSTEGGSDADTDASAGLVLASPRHGLTGDNRGAHVQDFYWLRSTPSPHWSVMEAAAARKARAAWQALWQTSRGAAEPAATVRA